MEQQERSWIVEQPAWRVVELGLCLVFDGEPVEEFFGGEGGGDLIFIEHSLCVRYCLSCFLHLAVTVHL